MGLLTFSDTLSDTCFFRIDSALVSPLSSFANVKVIGARSQKGPPTAVPRIYPRNGKATIIPANASRRESTFDARSNDDESVSCALLSEVSAVRGERIRGGDEGSDRRGRDVRKRDNVRFVRFAMKGGERGKEKERKIRRRDSKVPVGTAGEDTRSDNFSLWRANDAPRRIAPGFAAEELRTDGRRSERVARSWSARAAAGEPRRGYYSESSLHTSWPRGKIMPEEVGICLFSCLL